MAKLFKATDLFACKLRPVGTSDWVEGKIVADMVPVHIRQKYEWGHKDGLMFIVHKTENENLPAPLIVQLLSGTN